MSLETLIKRLGKPRSWLVLFAACLLALFLGGICIGLYFAGIEIAGRIGLWIVIVCWLVAAWSCVSYFRGQFSQRYRNLHGKGWADLPW